MTVKQLYEILGKFIDIGAGEWVVLSSQREQFKTRKEHRELLKTEPSRLNPHPFPLFVVGEVIPVGVVEDGIRKTTCLLLLPPFLIKDENRAFYYLPTEEFLKVDVDTPLPQRLPRKLELAAKASKGSKKGFKKSAKTTKGAH